jgi:hydroxymethylpyrimidine/phosphomethylpyrimidine kinase
VAITVAGTDSAGGAGVAADLRTFAAHGVHGTFAVTAVTAQDTLGVKRVQSLDADMVEAQIEAVRGDLDVGAAKTGMLGTTAVVDLVARLAGDGHLPNLVVDPVLASSSGHLLLKGDGPGAYRRLLPHALVVTPNLRETSLLVGRPVADLEAMVAAARELHELGCRYVVVKGGHLAGDEADDVVFDGKAVTVLRAPMIETRNNHGTGCTLSASIAAELALGAAPLEAIARSKEYVSRAIAGSAGWKLGGGAGPLDQLCFQAEADEEARLAPPGAAGRSG